MPVVPPRRRLATPVAGHEPPPNTGDPRWPHRALVKQWLIEADAAGDGPMVNALCEYGRERWGPDLDW